MIDFDKLKTINTSIDHIFHGKIMECDMREASLQIAEKFNLLSREDSQKRITVSSRKSENISSK